MPLLSTVMWPVTATAGVVASYNVALLAALVLDGVCSYAWLRSHTSRSWPAAVASLLVVFGPYNAARAGGHLNLLLWFPIPLVLLLVERVVREPATRRLRRGLALGLLCAVQLLLTEEVLVLAAIVIVVALLVAAAVHRGDSWRRIVIAGPTALAAVVAFSVIAAGPLWYQFFGPGVVRVPIQARDFYVNDLLNTVIPTTATALSPVSADARGWTGNRIEWNGYIGIPLLVVAVVAAVRGRRDRRLRVLAITLVVVEVLSLGPELHVDGHLTHVSLPAVFFDVTPGLDNLLPNRFSLFLDLGLAAVVALVLDRPGLRPVPRAAPVAQAAMAAVVVASLWPAAPPTSVTPVPAYFAAGGDVFRLPAASAALVLPASGVGANETVQKAPGLWQATSGFHVRFVSGDAFSATPGGVALVGTLDEPVRCVVGWLQLRGTVPATCGDPSLMLAELSRLDVSAVVVGPGTPYRDAVVAYFTTLLGRGPQADQGVLAWRLAGG